MTCEKCGTDVDRGRLVVRRAFAGFACYGCAEEIRRIEWEEKIMARKNGKAKKGSTASPKDKAARSAGGNGGGSLAAIIDPMLLAGGKTVKEIAAELAKKASDAAKGKDLAANVRARMVSYTRKGWRVEKDNQKHVMVVQQNG